MSEHIEIIVRSYYVCDMGDVVADAAYTIELSPDIQWADLLAGMLKKRAETLKDYPANGLRPMTLAEIEEYKNAQSEETDDEP